MSIETKFIDDLTGEELTVEDVNFGKAGVQIRGELTHPSRPEITAVILINVQLLKDGMPIKGQALTKESFMQIMTNANTQWSRGS